MLFTVQFLYVKGSGNLGTSTWPGQHVTQLGCLCGTSISLGSSVFSLARLALKRKSRKNKVP